MPALPATAYTPATAYLPNPVTGVPKPVKQYARSQTEAPLTALERIRADGKIQEQIENRRRYRVRSQVGDTNRWRLPQALISDLLGMAQAHRSIQDKEAVPFNATYVKLYSAESRHRNLNEYETDASRMISTTFYPGSGPVHGQPTLSATSSLRSQNRNAQSAPAFSRHDRRVDMTSYVPSQARPTTCQDIFMYHSKTTASSLGPPDILLSCLGVDYELHCSVLQRSGLLSELMAALEDGDAMRKEEVYYKNTFNDPLDSLVNSSGLYENKPADSKLSPPERSEAHNVTHPVHISTVKTGRLHRIRLEIPEHLHVSRKGMAVALGNLYSANVQVERQDLSQVMEAAHFLQFGDLVDQCEACMRCCIDYSNISAFYLAAKQCQRYDLGDCCVRWTELNLIPIMMTRVQLRNLPLSLLETALKSSRLFTYSEYHLYACLCLWLFLHLNPQIQLLPTATNVITYFNRSGLPTLEMQICNYFSQVSLSDAREREEIGVNLSKASSFLEREGQMYIPLFNSLRLHGITDTTQFENIRLMNVLTKESMVNLLSEHYSALQSGGDMALMRNFRLCAVRQGYVIEREIPFHSEILSLHGFHFELKTVKAADTYTFYMQRLKPTDTMLSFKHCERQTFSMRPDRDVIYSISVQTYDSGLQNVLTTGTIRQRFGLSGKQVRSKTLSVERPSPPLYVTFCVLFPLS